MHDAGCIEAAKATFREEMRATLTAPVWDAEAMEAEEAYVDAWAREWLDDGTKSCECRQSTDATMHTTTLPAAPGADSDARAAIRARGFTPLWDRDTPAMVCASASGDTYAAPDWPSLAHYARHYLLCFCGGHTGR